METAHRMWGTRIYKGIRVGQVVVFLVAAVLTFTLATALFGV